MHPFITDNCELVQWLTTGQANLWVLLVGINHYQDPEFPALCHADADCHAIGAALTEATREFPQTQIRVYHDFAVQLPTFKAVSASLQQITTSAQAPDTVLFYFSGYSVVEPATQQAVLCLSDTQQSALLDTALQLQDLLRSLATCQAQRQIVWLDVCHRDDESSTGAANATAQLFKRLKQQSIQHQGFYSLVSGNVGQQAEDFPKLQHRLFANCLIQGLAGEAANSQGVIDADGLYRYIYHQMLQSLEQNHQQLRESQAQPASSPHPASVQPPQQIGERGEAIVLGYVPAKVLPESNPTLQSSADSGIPENLPEQSNSLAIANVMQPEPPIIQLPSARHLRFQRWVISQPALIFWMGVSIVLGCLGLRNLLAVAPLPSVFSALSPDRPYACNLQAELLSSQPGQLLAPQVGLTNCRTAPQWQQVTVQPLRGPLGSVWSVALTPDGKSLACGTGNAIALWDLQTQAPPRTLTGHTDLIYAIAISPDGNVLASGSKDKTIKLWNLRTGVLIRTLKNHSDAVWSVAISPDGNVLASGSADKTIKLWNLQTGGLIQTLIGHQNWVFSLAFSPDQQHLASGSKDKTIKLWDWRTGQQLRTLTGHKKTVRAIAFDASGRRLASASWDQTIKLWEIPRGTEAQTFPGHTHNIVAVAFSPDGKVLASSGVDNTVKLWNLDTQAQFATLYGHLNWVLALAFGPDGKTLVSGSRDRTITVWRW